MRRVLIVLALVPLLGCSSAPDPAGEELRVYAAIEPLASLAREIAGERAVVRSLVQQDESPETFQPTPKTMAALASSQLYLAAELPFEEILLARVEREFEGLRVARPCAGLADLAGHDHAGHDHEGCTHGGFDPHVWLSPAHARRIAAVITKELSALDPDSGRVYTQRRIDLDRRLAELDEALRAQLAPCAGRELWVFHPAYGYFAESYGLEQVAIEEGGLEPGSRRLGELVERARAAELRAIFVQPQFSQAEARRIADEIGAELVVLDPLPADYESGLRAMGATIAKALCGEPR